MLEGAGRPLLSPRRFAARMAAFLLVAVLLDSVMLLVGAFGYHFLEGHEWLDATVNSALIMTGNGPAQPAKTAAGKVFTIVNAVVGVVVFAAVIAVFLAPVFHRILHIFHGQHQEHHEKESKPE